MKVKGDDPSSLFNTAEAAPASILRLRCMWMHPSLPSNNMPVIFRLCRPCSGSPSHCLRNKHTSKEPLCHCHYLPIQHRPYVNRF